jgi:hypothetical protein
MYYDFIQQHKQRVKVIALAVVTLIIFWGIITYVGRVDKTPVVIRSVPSDAKIIFRGQNESNGTSWLKEGSYKVTVSKDGFATLTKTILVSDKKSQNVVALSLTPQSDEAKKWAAEHSKDYQNNETYGAIEADANGSYFSSLYPITAKLPFNDPYFQIGYITNEDLSISLTITTPSPRYRFYAVEKIRNLGYDPTDFKIIFKDFHNPLGVAQK